MHLVKLMHSLNLDTESGPYVLDAGEDYVFGGMSHT